MDDRERIQDPRWVLATVRTSVRRLLGLWRIRHIGHNDEDDLVNIVLLSLYTNERALLACFDPSRASAKYYLYFLTKQRLAEARRKQGRRAQIEKEHAIAEGAGELTSEDPEELLRCREIQAHIEKSLAARVSPTDLQIYREAFLESQTNPEIAAKLNIPKSKVANRIFALRRQVTRLLAELDMFIKGRKT